MPRAANTMLTLVAAVSFLLALHAAGAHDPIQPSAAIAGTMSPDQSGATSVPSGTVLASDNFSNPTAGLFSSGSDSQWTWGYVNGDYQIASTGTVLEADHSQVATGMFGDVAITVDTHEGPSASGTVDAGVGCRVSGSGSNLTGYRFRYDFNQGFWLLQRLDPGNAVRLGQGQLPGAPVASATHHLKLTCASSTITAFVDGIQAGTAQDNNYSQGGAMLLARAAGNDTIGVANGAGFATKVDVRFDNFIVTQP